MNASLLSFVSLFFLLPVIPHVKRHNKKQTLNNKKTNFGLIILLVQLSVDIYNVSEYICILN